MKKYEKPAMQVVELKLKGILSDRSLGLFVALMLSMLMVPTVAMAEDFVEGGLYYSTLTDNTVQVVKPTEGKYVGDITIPEAVTHNGIQYPVTAIGDNAFQASGVTSVILPLTGITSIGSFAFNDCTGLTEFTLPASITSIGQRAFYCCDKLKHLYVHSTDPTSYNPGSEAFSYIHYGSHICTLHVPTGCTAAYAADGSPFKSFTQVEEFDPPQAYDLVIASTRVTSFNALDVLGDGVASYNASTNTLTIQGNITATGSGYEGVGVISNIANLTVQVAAPSTITATDQGMFFIESATITGTSVLTINNTTNDVSIGSVKGTITIDNANLNLTGQVRSDHGKLLIQSSNVAVSAASSLGAIFGWDEFTLTGCYFENPEDGVYDTSDKRVEDENGNVAKTVSIIPGTGKVYYDLWIAGIQAHSKNASDILGNGAASYDASINTLSIKGNLSAPGSNLEGVGITSNIADLTVLVSKPATITASEAGMYFSQPATITGASLLTVTNGTKGSITASDADVTIKNANLNLAGPLVSYSHGKLTVESSTIAISTTSANGGLSGWDDLTLTGCYIETPEKGVYDTTDKRIENLDDVAAMSILIKPGTPPVYYDLYVAGTHVHSNNALDILGNGAASYNISTNTLTISGDITASGSGFGSAGIVSNIANLTVLVSAPATIIAEEIGLYFAKPATITGASLLTVNSTNDVAIAAYMTDIAISAANLTLNGQVRGNQGDLTINSSNVTVSTTSSSGAIFEWDAIHLTDCYIETPEKGAYDTSDKRVEDKDGDVAKSVKIGIIIAKGDVNHDGKIDKTDVDLTVQHILGKKPANFFEGTADMNGDKKINAADLVLIVAEANKP